VHLGRRAERAATLRRKTCLSCYKESTPILALGPDDSLMKPGRRFSIWGYGHWHNIVCPRSRDPVHYQREREREREKTRTQLDNHSWVRTVSINIDCSLKCRRKSYGATQERYGGKGLGLHHCLHGWSCVSFRWCHWKSRIFQLIKTICALLPHLLCLWGAISIKGKRAGKEWNRQGSWPLAV
jgi:hypothetical protein